MRNLKKVLSLALALVMLVGMMVVGAGATSFKDDDSIQNKEAVEVVSGIGVFEGDGTGNFNPKGTLTRAQAAVLIAKLDLGAAFGNLATTNASSFSDVPANHWGKAYIDYCAARGLIAGDGAGKFLPDQEVSGVGFALMVCRVLGYEDANEDVGGATWEVKAAALARKAGLTKDVTIGSQVMTRDEMAQVTFNALQADMVEYDRSGISIGEIVIPGSKATVVKGTEETGGDYRTSNVSAKDTTKQLCEEKFPGLVLHDDDGDDGFGRTVNVWSNKGETIYTGETSLIPAKKTFSFQTIKDSDLKGLTWSNDASDETITDGKCATRAVNAAAVKALGKDNNVVELYAGSDGKINKVIVINTYAGLVTVTEANEKKDIERSINIKGVSDLNKLETEDWEKNQVVLYNKSWDGSSKYNIKNVDAADSVTGTLTRVSSDSKTLTVSGTAYGFSNGPVSGTSAAAVKNDFLGVADQVFYLDAAGKNIIYATEGEDAPAIKDYAMILAADVVRTSSFGTDTLTMKVKALLSDGTFGTYKVELKKAAAAISDGGSQPAVDQDDWTVKIGNITKTVVAKADAENQNKTNAQLSSEALGVLDETVYTYTLKDDTMTLKGTLGNVDTSTAGAYAEAIAKYSDGSSKDAIKKNSSSVKVASDEEVVLNSNTAYVLYQENKTPTVVTGAANLGATQIDADGAHKAYIVVEVGSNKLPVATCVFSTGVAPAADNVGDYVYVSATYESGTNEDGDEVFYKTGWTPDGDELEVTVEDGSKANAGIFTYDTDKKLGAAPSGTGITVVEGGVVTAVSEDTVAVKKNGSTTYLTTDDDTKTVSVDDDQTELDVGATVSYVAKDGKAMTIYVTGEAATYTAALAATPVTVSQRGDGSNFNTPDDWEVTLSKTEGLNAGDTVTVTIKYKGSDTDANDTVATEISAGTGHGTITQATSQSAVLTNIKAGLTEAIVVGSANLTDIAVAITVTKVD